METITNVASTVATTVSKTIWGEPNTTQNETAGNEPIAGEQGKGTVTDPFDKGNAETENPPTSPTPPEPKFTSDTPSSSEPLTLSPDNNASASKSSDETPITDKTGAMSNIGPDTSSPNPLQSTDKTGVTGSHEQSTKASDVIPSESLHTGVAPTSGGLPHQGLQGADGPKAAPNTEEVSATKSKKDEAEDILKGRDPNDHSGEPLKVHNGSTERSTEHRRDSKAGQPGGGEHGKEQGTGEQWVKSRGLAAEGGDFDATKPGAGREANRIFEEKGLQKGVAGEPAVSTGGSAPQTSGADADDKEKTKLSQRIKEKLHIGHHNK